jgi:hypothetical protein
MRIYLNTKLSKGASKDDLSKKIETLEFELFKDQSVRDLPFAPSRVTASLKVTMGLFSSPAGQTSSCDIAISV